MLNGGAQVFISGQHTVEAWNTCKEWLSEDGLAAPFAVATKVSAPPFNLPELPEGGVSFPSDFQKLNVPCYGGILDEVMALFSSKEFRECAEAMNINIPEYKIDSFLKRKMPIVRDMVEAARTLTCCTGHNLVATEKLKSFADDFEKVNDADFKDMTDWKKFMEQHVAVGWENKLSFDEVLSNFGFDDAFASALRKLTTEVKDAKLGTTQTVDWEHHGLRWVSKAMTGFKPAGCLTDVVNLVFAMEGYSPADVAAGLSESQIKAVIRQFGSKLPDVKSCWMPTHMIVDCESDDMLAWCLVASIRKPKVLVQLPMESGADCIERHLSAHLQCKVFRDQDSRNMQALAQYWTFLSQDQKTNAVKLAQQDAPHGTLARVEVELQAAREEAVLARRARGEAEAGLEILRKSSITLVENYQSLRAMLQECQARIAAFETSLPSTGQEELCLQKASKAEERERNSERELLELRAQLARSNATCDELSEELMSTKASCLAVLAENVNSSSGRRHRDPAAAARKLRITSPSTQMYMMNSDDESMGDRTSARNSIDSLTPMDFVMPRTSQASACAVVHEECAVVNEPLMPSGQANAMGGLQLRSMF